MWPVENCKVWSVMVKHIQTLIHVGNYVVIAYCLRLILLWVSELPVVSSGPSERTEDTGAIT